ncbi:MAG: hypothetical protein HUK14_00380 [Muribaculaceae bacterium]|nr:hypothetical protein [Muribaculaceae bacterium]
MKMQLKSLIALAVAVTLGLGFSSCKKNEEPDPKPTEKTYVFNNAIAFNTGLLDVCDITLEYTDLNGKTETKDVKNLSTKKTTHADKEYTMYVFEEKSTTKTIPAETTVTIKYTVKSDLPAEGTFDCYILPGFYCGTPSASGEGWSSYASESNSKYLAGLPYDKAATYIERLNNSYNKYTLKFDKDGSPYSGK